jgi:hypothetical protein
MEFAIKFSSLLAIIARKFYDSFHINLFGSEKFVKYNARATSA